MTARSDLVESSVTLTPGPPPVLVAAEHVVEADLPVPSGKLVISGPADYPSQERFFSVLPGLYRARVSYVPAGPCGDGVERARVRRALPVRGGDVADVGALGGRGAEAGRDRLGWLVPRVWQCVWSRPLRHGERPRSGRRWRVRSSGWAPAAGTAAFAVPGLVSWLRPRRSDARGHANVRGSPETSKPCLRGHSRGACGLGSTDCQVPHQVREHRCVRGLPGTGQRHQWSAVPVDEVVHCGASSAPERLIA